MAQFYQYNHRMFHPEAMDSRKYAYSFLRFDEDHRDGLGGNYRIAPFHPNGLIPLLHEKWDAEGTGPIGWDGGYAFDDAPSPDNNIVVTWWMRVRTIVHHARIGTSKGCELTTIGFERSA